MEEIVSFGEWARRRRQALGLTRGALAAQVGCSPVTIKKIEREERRPSVQIAALLADNLGIKPERKSAFISFARMELDSVEAQLPPQVVKAARARGQASDMWQTAVEVVRQLAELGQGK